jgi:integrase
MQGVKGQRYLYRRGEALYFRRGVPHDARLAFQGRSEVLVSLRTSSVAEARHKLQREVDKFEKVLADCRSEIAPAQIAAAPYLPTHRELEAGVRAAFAQRLERIAPVNRTNKSDVEAALLRIEDLKRFRATTVASRQVSSDGYTMDVVWAAEALCERNRWAIDADANLWWPLVDLVARAQIEAAERQLQGLQAEPHRTIDESFAAEQFLGDDRLRDMGEIRTGPPPTLMELFDAYVKERKPRPATVKSFGSKVRALIAFLGHDDARRVTKQDITRWKQHLLERGGKNGGPLSARSVRETFLTAVRTRLERGVESGNLRENVAAGVSVLGRKVTVRKRRASFKDDEAEKILRASLAEQSGRLSDESRLARRWVPWLCAYTGARVNEITQLRADDVSKVDGVWTILITPEAGGTKDGNARLVALHPHLVEQGFPTVAKEKGGYLFVDLGRRRGGSDQNPQTKKVGEHLARWVREIGVDEPEVQPNHGWRHRFKTVARECRMSEEVRDYIQGHVPRTEGEKYGEFSPKVLLREIKRLPRYRVEG